MRLGRVEKNHDFFEKFRQSWKKIRIKLDFSSSSTSNSLFHLTTKLTQTKTANENNGRKIGNSDKSDFFD